MDLEKDLNILYARLSRKNVARIFNRDQDYRYFLRLLRKYKTEEDVSIFAFCLLPDSVHLVSQPLVMENLRRLLSHLVNSYQIYDSIWGNKRADRWNIKIAEVNGDKEFQQCIQSIEFKPVFHDLAASPSAYPWSSCRYRLIGDPAGMLDLRGLDRVTAQPTRAG